MSTITGTSGTDVLIGGPDNDTIIGLEGNDQLIGNEGSDSLDGGPGNDILTGGPGSDVLFGGTGADIFRDTAAGLNGDHILDLLIGDRIQFTDLNTQNANFAISGSTLTYTGGSVVIDNIQLGRLIVQDIAGGGVEIRRAGAAHNDFNGDGISDILWRNDGSGALVDWLGNSRGGFGDNSANFNRMVSSDWQVAGTGDFNGDGHVDVLWRNSAGTLTDWLGASSGNFADNTGNFVRNVSTDWAVVGVGDFNGDGHADVLWRNSSGVLTDWLGNNNGSFSDNLSNFVRGVDNDWRVVGTGDFNGDGLTDILWRNSSGVLTDWLGTASGAFVDNVSNFVRAVGTDWNVAGIGDFNGDGRDDILWRNSSGTLTDWLGTSTGAFADNIGNFVRNVSTSWQVHSVGDFNGDGVDDLLWTDNNGTVTDWLGTSRGAFADNNSNFVTHVDTTWHMEPRDVLI